MIHGNRQPSPLSLFGIQANRARKTGRTSGGTHHAKRSRGRSCPGSEARFQGVTGSVDVHPSRCQPLPGTRKPLIGSGILGVAISNDLQSHSRFADVAWPIVMKSERHFRDLVIIENMRLSTDTT